MVKFCFSSLLSKYVWDHSLLYGMNFITILSVEYVDRVFGFEELENMNETRKIYDREKISNNNWYS